MQAAYGCRFAYSPKIPAFSSRTVCSPGSSAARRSETLPLPSFTALRSNAAPTPLPAKESRCRAATVISALLICDNDWKNAPVLYPSADYDVSQNWSLPFSDHVLGNHVLGRMLSTNESNVEGPISEWGPPPYCCRCHSSRWALGSHSVLQEWLFRPPGMAIPGKMAIRSKFAASWCLIIQQEVGV